MISKKEGVKLLRFGNIQRQNVSICRKRKIGINADSFFFGYKGVKHSRPALYSAPRKHNTHAFRFARFVQCFRDIARDEKDKENGKDYEEYLQPFQSVPMHQVSSFLKIVQDK